MFFTSLIWGAGIYWVAIHPPMIDLPQHASQVVLLRDMLAGESPWERLVYVNLWTPYLIGYGLALSLSTVMPVTLALKLLLSLAYLGFVALCVLLRRHFDGDPRLDWLFLFGSVSFASQWGFFTFLVSAPIALAFILVADRYGQRLSLARGAIVLALGLLLLISHGLAFVFAWLIGAALLIARAWPRARRLAAALAPHALLGLACLLYFLRSRRLEAALGAPEGDLVWSQNVWRPVQVFSYSIGATHEAWMVVAIVLLLCAPWLLGLRIAWRSLSKWLPFAAVLVVLLATPAEAFATAFLYHRFAMFLLPAYAWMFTLPARPTPGAHGPVLRQLAAAALMALTCWAVLGVHTLRAWRFDKEEADFRAVLAAVAPGERALGLIFDRGSDAAHHWGTYVHQASWYQAEKGGFVDFNFAWFAPQVARFRPGMGPPVKHMFEWYPERFDWQTHRGRDYRYFFVRRGPRMPPNLFEAADCAPLETARSGLWTVYERQACPSSTAPSDRASPGPT